LKIKFHYARLLLQREETKRYFSGDRESFGIIDANNVQVSVLHVMNVNHTEKRLSTCSKKDEASKKAGHRCFRFQMAEEIRSFEKLDGINKI
jgi:hypothetical protein